ncbi:hypothetical protein Fot_14215 [Forsythia ovata]|uniref:Uncharacterized protein n=1 Tax=Forsythia ovata TaxID=205694 RepID=A0ABD1W5Z0_9LAMI
MRTAWTENNTGMRCSYYKRLDGFISHFHVYHFLRWHAYNFLRWHALLPIIEKSQFSDGPCGFSTPLGEFLYHDISWTEIVHSISQLQHQHLRRDDGYRETNSLE